MVKKYPRYKESGIPWIGEIPSDWGIVKTGRLFRNTKEIVGQKSASTERLALTLSGVIKRDKNDAEGLQPEQFDGYQYLRKNQLVFKLIDLENVNTSRVGLCPFEEGMVSPAYIILKNDTKDNKFYYYFFLSLWHNEVFNHLGGDGVRSALNAKDLLNVPTVNISQAEQQAIADYLDKKCAAIDNTIETEEKVIEKLKEYKQSLITETVTKGLDKSVPMKDSGIPWIGQIPQHWEMKRLKQILSKPLQYGANESGEPFNEELPRYIRITDIKIEDNTLKEDGKLSLSLEKAKGYILENDDILLARSGATVGKTFLYKSKYGLSAFAGYLIRATVKQNLSAKYVYYFTLSNAYEEWKNRIFIQATIQNIGANKYNNLEIPIPLLEEQTKIVIYLDEKCSKIDKAIADKEQVIEKLTEYKKSLIYECVTGKRMVA